MHDDRRDDLDRLLDEALGNYSAVEPQPGIERRVMLHVSAAYDAARRRLLHWGLPLVATAVLLLLIISTRTPPVSGPTPATRPDSAERSVASERDVRSNATSSARGEEIEARVTATPARPQRDQFPAAAPLTVEERHLLAWIGSAPEQALEVFSDLQRWKQGPEPIPEIQIPPLQSERNEDAEKNGVVDVLSNDSDERDVLLPDPSGEAGAR